tara:strand:- start:555 stop:782 length:228 start_codon:yes stop_codon:yes gene_type:complete
MKRDFVTNTDYPKEQAEKMQKAYEYYLTLDPDALAVLIIRLRESMGEWNGNKEGGRRMKMEKKDETRMNEIGEVA